MLRVIYIAFLLSSCGREAPVAEGNPDNVLEAAARDRGLVRADRAAPSGVFERRHELGRDALCVVPDGGDYRFALTASFGPGLVCQGRGALSDNGGEWTFRFAGDSGCRFVASEAEDELRIPGVLPDACAQLCPNRASISGLRLPRASWDAREAARVRFARPDGQPGVGCTP